MALLLLILFDFAMVVELLESGFFGSILISNGLLQVLNVSFSELFLLLRLFFVLSQVLILLVSYFFEFLCSGLQVPQLLLYGLFLFQGSGQLSVPEGLHLLECLDEANQLVGSGVANGLEFQLHLGSEKLSDYVGGRFPDVQSHLFGLFLQEVIIKWNHLAVWPHVVLFE
jgi:hypothetical protein